MTRDEIDTEIFNSWWTAHCYGNDFGGVVYKHCLEAYLTACYSYREN